MTINGTGSVGIANSSPSATLHVGTSSSDSFWVGSTGGGNLRITNGKVSGYWQNEANPRFELNRDTVGYNAGIGFGPGGSTAIDTILYRPSANTLRTNDNVLIKATLGLMGSSSGTVKLSAPATVTTSYTLTLPPAAPASNGLVLSSNTSGVTSWIANGAGMGCGGTCSQNYHAKFGASGTSLVNSIVYDNGTAIGVRNTAPAALVTIGTNGTVGGSLSLAGATSGTVTFDVPTNVNTSYTLTFPDAPGNNNQVLATTGNGDLVWKDPGSITNGIVCGGTPVDSYCVGNYVTKFNSNLGIIKSQIYDTTNIIGINTTNGDRRLTVYENASAQGGISIEAPEMPEVRFKSNNTVRGYLGIERPSQNGYGQGTQGNALVLRSEGNYLHFMTNGGSSLAMTINGMNTGFGNNNPSYLLTVGTAGSRLGQIYLAGNGSGSVLVQPSTSGIDWTLTLPPDRGMTGQFLRTDGGGNTTWASASGSSSFGFNSSTANQGAGFASDTYLTGSNVQLANPGTSLKAGTRYRLVFTGSKTAAGTGAPVITIRYGTNASTGDASVCAMTFGAGTAAADTAVFQVWATFRAVGGAARIQCTSEIEHSLASTGFTSTGAAADGIIQTTGGTFNSSVNNSYIGVSVNGGTGAAWTITQAQADLSNLN